MQRIILRGKKIQIGRELCIVDGEDVLPDLVKSGNYNVYTNFFEMVSFVCDELHNGGLIYTDCTFNENGTDLDTHKRIGDKIVADQKIDLTPGDVLKSEYFENGMSAHFIASQCSLTEEEVNQIANDEMKVDQRVAEQLAKATGPSDDPSQLIEFWLNLQRNVDAKVSK